MYIIWYVTQNNMSRTCGLPGHGKYDLKLTQNFVKQNSEKIAQCKMQQDINSALSVTLLEYDLSSCPM